MTERFLGRELNEREQRLRADHRCIGCGVKVPVSQIRTKDGESRQPMECTDCLRTRTNRSAPTDGRDFGAARASIAHGAQAAMGYAVGAGGVPGRHGRGDTDECLGRKRRRGAE